MAAAGKRKGRLASGRVLIPRMGWLGKARLWKRESPLERRVHSSIIRHMNEKPEAIPGEKTVNAVAHDLVMMYAKQVKVPHKYMPRVRRLSAVEVNPEIGPTEKMRQFKNIAGNRAKIVEAVKEMDAVAHGFANEDRLAELYLEDVLNKIKGPIYVKDKAGQTREVSRTYLATVVERAAQKAAIVTADMKSTFLIQLRH